MLVSSQRLGLCFDYSMLNKETFWDKKEYAQDPVYPDLLREINPQTGEFWKLGEMDELTGLFFRGYDRTSKRKKSNVVKSVWVTEDAYLKNKESVSKAVKKLSNTLITSSVEGHIYMSIKSIKAKCIKEDIPFNIDVEYMLSIAPTHCPVFGMELGWCRRGDKQNDSPSIDRIVPELGYVKGNVQYLSDLANRMKQNATGDQLRSFARWVLKPPKPVEINKNLTEGELVYLQKRLYKLRERSKKDNRDFDLVLQNLLDITPTHCPVFGVKFVWGSKDRLICPSIDKIDPRFGYTLGNIQIISNLANSIKNNATPSQLEEFARWIFRTYEGNT